MHGEGMTEKYTIFHFQMVMLKKTTISKEPKKVIISNEKQLNNQGLNNLFLSVFLLEESDSGKSLPEYIDEIRTYINEDSQTANPLFEVYLKHAKYLEKHRKFYEQYKIVNQEVLLYRVEDGFLLHYWRT